MAALLGEIGQQQRLLAAAGGRIEPQADKVEHDAVERHVECLDRHCGKSEATRRRSAGESQAEGIGAAFQLGEREPRRFDGIRMIDARRDAPASGFRAQRAGGLLCRSLVERFDPDTVRRPPDQLFLEIGTLQYLVDRSAPLRFARRGERRP
jgi:hypothetical protein